MAEIGQGSPEFRMIIGKSHLNRGEYDDAVRELEAAAQADPKLPLLRMGHEKEDRGELAVATKMLNDPRAARHKELEGEAVPSPELARKPE